MYLDLLQFLNLYKIKMTLHFLQKLFIIAIILLLILRIYWTISLIMSHIKKLYYSRQNKLENKKPISLYSKILTI
jgi:hypothetical protein